MIIDIIEENTIINNIIGLTGIIGLVLLITSAIVSTYIVESQELLNITEMLWPAFAVATVPSTIISLMIFNNN